MSENQSFEFSKPTSRRTLYGIVAAVIVFGVGFIMLGLSEDGFDRYQLVAIGVATLGSGAVIVSLYAKRLAHEGPELAIDQRGLTVYGVGLVPWEEITGLVVRRAYQQDVVGFKVRDRHRVIKNVGLGHRLQSCVMERQHGFAVALVPDGVGTTQDAVVSTVLRHRQLPVEDLRR